MLDDDPVAEIKFRTADGSPLCELNLKIPVSCIYFFHFGFNVSRHHSFPGNYLLKPGFHKIVRIASWRLVLLMYRETPYSSKALRLDARHTSSKIPSWLCHARLDSAGNRSDSKVRACPEAHCKVYPGSTIHLRRNIKEQANGTSLITDVLLARVCTF